MKKTSLSALLISLLPLSAFAGPYYMNIGGGISYPAYGSTTNGNSNSVTYAPAGTTNAQFALNSVNWQSNFQSIYNANFAIGKELSPAYRVEGEFFYQRLTRNVTGTYNWVQQSSLGGDTFANSMNTATGKATGSTNLYSLMANVYYDFRNQTHMTPTIGAGLGLAYLWSAGIDTNNSLTVTDQTNPAASTVVPTFSNVPSLTSKALAWQIKAGFSYQPDNDLAIVCMYRLFGTTHFKAHSSYIIANPGVAGSSATFTVPGSDSRSMLTNSFDISFRYYFL